MSMQGNAFTVTIGTPPWCIEIFIAEAFGNREVETTSLIVHIKLEVDIFMGWLLLLM